MHVHVVSSITVPFHSIWQSHITGPSKMLKCHSCHGNFHGVPNSFGNHVTSIQIFSSPAALNCRKLPKNLDMSRQLWEVAETKISAGPSRVTGPAELNEIVQYAITEESQRQTHILDTLSVSGHLISHAIPE